ncbi:MAG: hypothetical protein H0X28_09365 [Solirubrobacterales bacterium]|nr:hypothetical protein [Solirubrobacterales bacterium]
MRITIRRGLSAALTVAGVVAVLAFSSAPAFAGVECGTCSAWWHVNSGSLPANLPPGGKGEISVLAEDLGAAGVSSSVVVKDKLPTGLTAQSVSLGLGIEGSAQASFGSFLCKIQSNESEVTCTVPKEFAVLFHLDRAYSHIEIFIKVKVAEAARSGEENKAIVSGGGALSASVSRPITVSAAPTLFGVEQYELKPENADGSPDTQAGSHPFQLTSVIGLNQAAEAKQPPAAVKDLRFNLPPGLIGNPTPFPQCPLAKFLANAGSGQNFCPDDTVVGIASVSISFPVGGGNPSTATLPLFALAPSLGEPARFGFDVLGDPVYLDTSVRTGSDYGVTVTVPNISEITGFISSRVTFWGVPGDSRHDSVRGWNCLNPQEGAPACTAPEAKTTPPLLTLPTACVGPLHTTVEADSWEEAGAFRPPFEYIFQDNLGRPVGMDGCNQLSFAPSIKVTPDGTAGSTPTGLTVDEHVPQDTNLNPEALAESDVKGLSVTLPEGVVLNPSAADGLQACSQAQIALQNAEFPSCPEASKVATVKIKTPLLTEPLEGAAYLATQNANPFGTLVALYVFAENPTAGVRVKAAGEVLENTVTGQLTAHFEHNPAFEGSPVTTQFLPQLPFEDVELHFFGGERAPLGTPARCGAYTTTGTFTPWSENATTESPSTFNITSGPNRTPCQNPLPFAPALTAGTTSIQAGGFSPFTTTISREDGSQNLQAISLHMPPGLSGLLSSVKLCGEVEANAGTCGLESQIGETTVSVGLGGDPFSVKGGRVYITGAYEGAPFGLSIVNPAVAGPFNLGHVVVRAKIEVDPKTADLTITTDNSGPYKIPSILDGIPLQIKHVNVTINRPGFTFNPTNCSKLAITGTLSSTEGATQALSVPFQATNCATLKFAPKFAVSTSGKTSKAKGASLSVKLSYPKAAFGSQANISKVKVDLPKQLPSRLTTLQKACTNAQFEANPAACPAESKIGYAVVHTPLLPVPLEGPAIFVSHGGEAFPSLTVVLQGDNVTIDLVGTTFISAAGVTSTTFKTVPDAPVGSFELTLPQGKYSALAANLPGKAKSSFCGQKLTMPTAFVAQNGAEIHESTKIRVTGCPKAKKAAKHKKHGKARGKNKGKK